MSFAPQKQDGTSFRKEAHTGILGRISYLKWKWDMEKFPPQYLQGNSMGTGLCTGQSIAILLTFILENESFPQGLPVLIKALQILFF